MIGGIKWQQNGNFREGGDQHLGWISALTRGYTSRIPITTTPLCGDA
jgi:hypothetical protein